ncbi:MAG: patatin-like phospholipase family protein [Variibacter sp.]|nr:patatin-like phospholipase family protein [Variibacter sp.]
MPPRVFACGPAPVSAPLPSFSPPRESEGVQASSAAQRGSQGPAAPARGLALVLGGGGARGLAHIPVLEALDELGVRPAVISGSSIGAVIGAAYAAGMSGKEIRRYVVALLHDRPEILRRLVAARAASLAELFSARFGNPMLIDAEQLVALFMPERVPRTFGDLAIRLKVMTTDLYARAERVFEEGPLRPALAASMAVPGLVRPVVIDGRVLIDGSAVNPLPFDIVRDDGYLTLAVDTSVGPVAPRGVPDPWDALFSAIQVMGYTIVAAKLRTGPPDIVIRPKVGAFRLLDFLHVSAILRAADPVKAEVKARLAPFIAA